MDSLLHRMNKSDRFVADKLKFDYKEKLKLKELLNGAYTIQPTFNGTWISDNEITYIRENGDFVILDVLTANITVIIYAHLMKQHEVVRATLSSNRQVVLFSSQIKNIFRHSTLARYRLYHLSTNRVIDLRPNEVTTNVHLQIAQWGPRDAQLVFVYRNNLYYMPEPELGRIVQLTNETNRYVYSAIADWIYEEEILASEKAFWWSKDGTRIAYAQFNDTLVEFQEFPWYGDSINHDTQYLDQVKIKYPKVSQKHKAHRSIVVN
ncbi:dipeptidyl peptidase IV-like protein 1 [Sarcoptes scabiei]|uniref:Dipeptidyl peptidase IV-like protein 1 n=1 Tax=Sarcoptes scabiei TaxID=52283 RepID=A0A131ZU42_SARSC|nr:dipeptidyl peptidase IV-like protein 1 [Sarcoptes scabiei]